jgi:hypothetical protein
MNACFLIKSSSWSQEKIFSRATAVLEVIDIPAR